MKESIRSINKDFYKNFQEIYSKPSKTNEYLKKYSNIVEKYVKHKFLELNLLQMVHFYTFPQ